MKYVNEYLDLIVLFGVIAVLILVVLINKQGITI